MRDLDQRTPQVAAAPGPMHARTLAGSTGANVGVTIATTCTSELPQTSTDPYVRRWRGTTQAPTVPQIAPTTLRATACPTGRPLRRSAPVPPQLVRQSVRHGPIPGTREALPD